MRAFPSAAVLIVLALGAVARAGEKISSIPEVGPHYKVLTIKSGIRKRFQVAASPPKSRDGAFSVHFFALDEVAHDLGATPLLWVRSKKTSAGCSAEASVVLGPSDGGAEVLLDEIDSEAVLKGPFSAKVDSITLRGTDAKTGKAVSRVYRAKP